MEWKHGIKSGAAAGVFYGILAGIVTVLYMVLEKEKIVQMLQSVLSSNANIPISTEQLYSITLISSFPSAIFGGVLTGIVFGVIYVLMKDQMIGKSPKMRGISLAILLFMALGVAELFGPENAIGAFFMLRFSTPVLIPLSFGAFLALGYFMGMFWDRFGEKSKR
ncbi:MAG: hypothetical protein JXC85_04310 [Candidatus Aenigmarchaeota archaeon]|nr:hypothetical protein [Candidatus Aenigmarchaeota archaeon]